MDCRSDLVQKLSDFICFDKISTNIEYCSIGFKYIL